MHPTDIFSNHCRSATALPHFLAAGNAVRRDLGSSNRKAKRIAMIVSRMCAARLDMIAAR